MVSFLLDMPMFPEGALNAFSRKILPHTDREVEFAVPEDQMRRVMIATITAQVVKEHWVDIEARNYYNLTKGGNDSVVEILKKRLSSWVDKPMSDLEAENLIEAEAAKRQARKN